MKHTPCTDCRMSRFAPKTQNNVAGWGNPDAKLVIVLDGPGHLLAEKLLIWILKRLSLTADDVWIDYTFRCQVPKELKKKELAVCHRICWTSHPRAWAEVDKVLVLAGNWSADFLANAKMKEWHGRKEPESGIWMCYSFLYLLMNPAECVDNWRVLYKAAEEAGLKPKMVVDIDPFRFPSKKLAGA